MTCLGFDDVVLDCCNRLAKRGDPNVIEVIDPVSGHVFHLHARGCPRAEYAYQVIRLAAETFGGR